MVCGYLSLLHSIGEKPLEYWSKQRSQSGKIRKILDTDLLENVIDIQDFDQRNAYGTSILCPADPSQSLNIELPIFVVVIKNLNLPCRIQAQVTDAQHCNHHFQFSNADFTRHNNLICRVKYELEPGWNKLEFDLSNLTERAFKCEYRATQRLEVRGNCRLRRIYFIDRHYEEHEICPRLYQGFLDYYMLKWGIHAVDKSTQTIVKKSKGKTDENNLHVFWKRSRSEAIVNRTNKPGKCVNNNELRECDQDFFTCLESKIDGLIDEFLRKQSDRLPQAMEFKQRAKIKPYVLPAVSPRDTSDKIDVPRILANDYEQSEAIHETEQSTKTTDDIKTCRYISSERELLNNMTFPKWKDLSRSTKSALDQKPKSTFLLAEVKNCKKELE